MRHYRHLRLCFVLLGMFVVGGAGIYSTNVARAQTDDEHAPREAHLVRVYDRGIERTILTRATTVREALGAAKIAVDERYDVVEPQLDTPLAEPHYRVHISRAQLVTVIDGERRIRVTTAAKTPELIVKAAGLELYDGDTVSMAMSQNVLVDGAGSVIQVHRAPYRSVTVDEPIAFSVETTKDDKLEVGKKEVTQPGKPGVRRIVYQIALQQGKEVDRRVIADTVITQPQAQHERIGTKPSAMAYTGGGSKDQWLAASQIPRDQWGYAEWLVQKESGWNPNARNRSSGACGLAQALPCSKVPGNPHDPVDSLNWMHGYVMRRYGSWANAVQHSKTKGWY